MAKHLFKGVEVYFEEHGQGPTVVLLHGFLESVWMWKDMIPELSKKHRVVVIDLPGHGKSENIGYVHQMDEMAQFVKSILDSIRIRKVTVVGHSMGGYVALAFADQFPDSMRKLVLYQSTARDDTPAKKKDRTKAIKLIQENHKSFIRRSIPLLFRAKNRIEFRGEINELKAEALKTSRQGVIAAITGMRDRPNREIILKFAPYPVSFIAGDKDPRISIEECEEEAKLSDGVTLHVIEGSGHMSYIEALPQTISILSKAVDQSH